MPASDTQFVSRPILRDDQDARTPALIRSLLLISALLLALTMAGAVMMTIEGSRGLQRLNDDQERNRLSDAELKVAIQNQATGSALRQTAWGAATGLMALGVIMGMALLWWRHQWQARLRWEQNRAAHEERRHRNAQHEIARKGAECKRLEDDLTRAQAALEGRIEERTAELAESAARLEAELDSRRKAERLLAEQAKELERSKDVLEMHVHLRTAELQKLQRLYESILNSAGEGIYGLDLEGRTTFVNLAAAQASGRSVDELVGKLERNVFLDNEATAAAASDDDSSPAVIFRRADGSTFPVEYVRTPIAENGRRIGEVVVFKDITERRRAEEALNRKADELARSNAELEQFAYVASHDLQEPLRKIQAFGDRLKVKCQSALPPDGVDYLERMQSASARMQTLINDLLTFSRVISTTRPFVPVDLAAVAREVLNDLEVRIEQTGAVVEVGELPTVEADPLQMRQLLLNLVSNALKFQPDGQKPQVKISGVISRQTFGRDGSDEFGEMHIQDNGIGFDEKYLEKIFVVFQRLHGRDRYAGTGVGLAVCRRITDRHSGTITARSRPGEGATFIVRLPIRHSRAQAEVAA